VNNDYCAINVGGLVYATSRSMLVRSGSPLFAHLDGDANYVAGSRDDASRPFFVGDGVAFAGVLRFMETGVALVPPGSTRERLRDALRYFLPGRDAVPVVTDGMYALRSTPAMTFWVETTRAIYVAARSKYLQEQRHAKPVLQQIYQHGTYKRMKFSVLFVRKTEIVLQIEVELENIVSFVHDEAPVSPQLYFATRLLFDAERKHMIDIEDELALQLQASAVHIARDCRTERVTIVQHYDPSSPTFRTLWPIRESAPSSTNVADGK